MSEERIYYEENGLLFHKSYDWECDEFKFCPEGMGDTGSNTAKQAIKRKDTMFLHFTRKLLLDGKRWPDHCNGRGGDRIAKTKIQYGWSKLLFKLKINKTRLFRTQHGMTRDPYTWHIAACTILKRRDLLYQIKIPWSLYSPTFWAWQKSIFTGKEKYRARYIRRELRGTPTRQYVKDMALVRAKAIDCWWLYQVIKDTKVKPNKG